MTAAAAKPKAQATAPTTLRSYPPYIEACRNIDRCRAHKDAAEDALASAQRMAREGAHNRAARVHALATGGELPAIEPDDHTLFRAEDNRSEAMEALTKAAAHCDQVASEFKAACLADVRDDRLDALRDQDEALAALEAAIRRQGEIQQSVRDRGVGTAGPGWYAALDPRQIADARQALRDCARQLGAGEL